MKLEVKIPSVGESINEVSIASWTKQDGDYVEEDEIIGEIDSDKATFELVAEQPGTIKYLVSEGDTVKVGDKVAEIDTDAKAKPAKEDGKEENKDESKEVKSDAKKETNNEEVVEKKEAQKEDTTYASGHSAPSAKKILEEHGIDVKSVKASGKDGRITREDALKAVDQDKAKKDAETTEKTAQTEPQTKIAGERSTRRESMSTLRKTIARRLVEVKNQTAMLTTFNEVDMSGIMSIRKKYKDAFKEKHEIGLGFMSFFTKAICEALQEFPAINAKIDGDEVVFHDYCDIGIAVSTPRGLVVPNIRNAETMSLAEIEKQIMFYATKARDGKISIEEMQGGTFTITNGGVFGSMLSTPILNAPQSAILGMHNIVERPVVINGEIVIRPIMYLALSYDHRIVDGKESVSFLVKVKQLLEDPARLLLQV